MKKLICWMAVFFAPVIGKGQAPTNIPLMTDNWGLLDLKSYKNDIKGHIVVYYPPALKALNQKTITLPGYIIPIKSGITHAVFLLSVVPVLQCQFCGQGDIPSMVEVHVLKPVLYRDESVVVKGMLTLNEKNDGGLEFVLTNAIVQ